MITSVNKSNVADYAVLYDDVTELLQHYDEDGHKDDEAGFNGAILGEGEIISTLEELFFYMPYIRKIQPKYTRLPLDEEPFNIDANARLISIPAAFAKNGLSVQGDEIAESVYFKTNRFYDHMDLATQNIFIQYKNAEGKEGVSKPAVIDIESEPGFIIFEWGVSSNVTAGAGKIQFSVRFYDFDDANKRLNYSLSTLPATIDIKASQNFDLVEHLVKSDFEDNKELMEDRLQQGPIYGNGYVEAPKLQEELPLTMNLAKPAEGEDPATGWTAVPVILQAYVENEVGQISYLWEPAGLTAEQAQAFNASIDTKMVETADATPREGKIYYIDNSADSEVPNYKKVAVKGTFDEDVVYYERVAYAEIGAVGSYKLTATNSAKGGSAKTTTPPAETDDDGNVIIKYCVVPAAQVPEQPVINSSAKLALDAEADAYNAQIKIVSPTTMKSPDAEGILTYQWMFSKDGEEFEAIEGANEATLKIAAEATVEGEDEEKVVSPTLVDGIAKGTGYYKLMVTNNLNNTTETVGCMDSSRVTYAPAKPYIEETSGNLMVDQGNPAIKNYVVTFQEAVKGISVSAVIPEAAGEDRTENDEIKYHWYRYVKGTNAESLEKDKLLASQGKYEYDGDANADVAEGDTYTASTYHLPLDYNFNKGNIFFCEVTNRYNGMDARVCSNFIIVTNTAEADEEQA